MKQTDRFILLPRATNASKLYAAVKIIVSFLFLAYFISLVAWTVHTMLFFKLKIDETSDVTRENQKYKTHNHFFLFTGLYVGAATLIGLWGILKENIGTIFGFLCLFGIGFLFEVTGAIKSRDEDVRKLKLVSVSLEPVLMLLALIFTVMIRTAEKRLAIMPIYRQTMAESRRNSLDREEIEKTGHDNPNLDLEDESDGSRMAHRIISQQQQSTPATLQVKQSD